MADLLLYFAATRSQRSIYVGSIATFIDVRPETKEPAGRSAEAVHAGSRPLWPEHGLWPASQVDSSATQRPEATGTMRSTPRSASSTTPHNGKLSRDPAPYDSILAWRVRIQAARALADQFRFSMLKNRISGPGLDARGPGCGRR